MSTVLGSVPGKVFLLGEYAVLAGLPALVVTVGPRFELRQGEIVPSQFHPQSPVAQLISEIQNSTLINEMKSWSFHDPLQGSGGFGASTAQFALYYFKTAPNLGWEVSWKGAWSKYRELTGAAQSPLSPSGADLIAQWSGGVTLFRPQEQKLEEMSGYLDFSNLLIFSATDQVGRKVATHDHLKSIPSVSVFEEVLRAPLEVGLEGLRKESPDQMGSAMNSYAEALESLGLEAALTRKDRHALRQLPGVLGVKGAGAMQADAILVWVKDSQSIEKVKELAASRSLRFVGNGNQKQAGIST